MLALSIRQPFAELILQGKKRCEYRSQSTKIIGERFHIYASRKMASVDLKVWSRDLSMPGAMLPDWLIELAEQVRMIEPGTLLPTGVIVGSAVIQKVSWVDSMYRWHLTDVERATTLRKPTGHPQPRWFRPF